MAQNSARHRFPVVNVTIWNAFYLFCAADNILERLRVIWPWKSKLQPSVYFLDITWMKNRFYETSSEGLAPKHKTKVKRKLWSEKVLFLGLFPSSLGDILADHKSFPRRRWIPSLPTLRNQSITLIRKRGRNLCSVTESKLTNYTSFFLNPHCWKENE